LDSPLASSGSLRAGCGTQRERQLYAKLRLMAEVYANLGCLGMIPPQTYANLGYPREGEGGGWAGDRDSGSRRAGSKNLPRRHGDTENGQKARRIAGIADIARNRKSKSLPRIHADDRGSGNDPPPRAAVPHGNDPPPGAAVPHEYLGHSFGSTIPVCFWYFPALSL